MKWKIGQDVRFCASTIGIVTNSCDAFPKRPGTFKVVWFDQGNISTESLKRPIGIETIGGVVYTLSKQSRPCPLAAPPGTWVITRSGELALVLDFDVTARMQRADPKPINANAISVVMLSGPKIGRRVLYNVRHLRIPQAITANAFMKETEDECKN